jgi:DNA-directed RNA polymerase subunit omega
MIYPSGDELEKRVDSKYSLVIAAAQRAKQLKTGARRQIDTRSTNYITIALEEIAVGKVRVITPTVAETAARIKKESEDRKTPQRPSDILKVDNIDDLDFDAALEHDDADLDSEEEDEVFEEYPLVPADTDENLDIDGQPIDEDEIDEDEMAESEVESDEF